MKTIALILLPYALSLAQVHMPSTAKTLRPTKPPSVILKVKTAKELTNAIYPKIYDEGFQFHEGVANSDFNLASNEVWAVGIESGRNDNAKAGFYSCGVQNMSTTTWKGMTVTATVEVSSVSGQIIFSAAGVGEFGNVSNTIVITHPGSYSCTSYPFDLPPNQVLRCQAAVSSYPATDTESSVHARITSIKFNLH